MMTQAMQQPAGAVDLKQTHGRESYAPPSRPFRLLRRLFQPMRSRKVRVAVATVIAALAAEHGLDVSEETVLAIVGVGVSLILGIAHEDAGRWSSPGESGGRPRTARLGE